MELELSWLQTLWFVWTIGIGSCAGFVVFFPQLAGWLRELVVYGKFMSSTRPWVFRCIEVPKRWFTHFYIIGSISVTLGLSQVINVYYLHGGPPECFISLLKFAAEPNCRVTVNELSVLIAMILLSIHIYRRFVESLFVSVYSDTKMNLIHYLVGCGHYVVLPFCLLAEAPGFAGKNFLENFDEILAQWRWNHVIGALLYVWASYHQHNCLRILASMRRNYLGNITTYAHGVPYDDWFTYVSCPHFLFEILIYFSICVILGNSHELWLYVFSFVAVNQFLAAQITHQWYVEKFGKLYPGERRALIPYVI